MPVQGDVPFQPTSVVPDVPAQAVVPPQANMCTQADMLSQTTALGRRDAPARGDYEDIAKHTRSASSRCSTHTAKKPCCSLTTELANTLPSPQRALEVAKVAREVHAPVVATQYIASEVALPLHQLSL